MRFSTESESDLSLALTATESINFHHPEVQAFVAQHHDKSASNLEKVLSLYYAVRDLIRYDPYLFSGDIEGFKASNVIAAKRGWCVPKSVLYTACCRAVGIPALLGFADVQNHLSTENMRKRMKTDVFYWHGYTSVFLEGKWVKATTAFNIELCEKFGLKPLEFNGKEDSLYHPFDVAGNQHMEYLNERGTYHDLPLAEMLSDFAKYYPGWGDSSEAAGNFEQEVARETQSKQANQ